MSSTETRLRTIISENLDLDHDPDFDRAFSDAGVSSVEAVAFQGEFIVRSSSGLS